MQKSGYKGLTGWGYKAPSSYGIFHHKHKGRDHHSSQMSLDYEKMRDIIAGKDDALRYIIIEAKASIRECKRLGQKHYNDSTTWEQICELQSSLERIHDNAYNELHRTE